MNRAGSLPSTFPDDVVVDLIRATGLRGRSMTKETDLTPQQWTALVELSAAVKKARAAATETPLLTGRTIALIFEKTSTRTRAAFEVAAAHQGAASTVFDSTGSQIGHKESVADTAQVLGRMYDAIQFRTDSQASVDLMADLAGVPVYNGLSDEWHPTQMLADQLTIFEHVAKPLNHVVHAYLGDARFNTGRSILVASALAGMDVRIAAPAAYQPPDDVVKLAGQIAARTGGKVTITESVPEATAGADVVSTDVWVSMGEPPQVWDERIAALGPYQVTAEVMASTGNEAAIFLHCLPAFHDLNTRVGVEIYQATGRTALEVTDEVFQSSASKVFIQAENRMHTIKAMLIASLANLS